MDILLLIIGVVLLLFPSTRRSGCAVLAVAAVILAVESLLAWYFISQLLEMTNASL